jgi:redox-sensitive bicupin YhaK (pirin superfamily)
MPIQRGARVEQYLPADYNGFVIILEGGGATGTSATEAQTGDVAWLTLSAEPSAVAFIGGAQGTRALLFAGKPLHKPVAARGPFVMNTETELTAGFAEFRAWRAVRSVKSSPQCPLWVEGV